MNVVLTLRHNTILADMTLGMHDNFPLTSLLANLKKAPLRVEVAGNVISGKTVFDFPVSDKSIVTDKAVPLLPKLLSFQDDYNLYLSDVTTFLHVAHSGEKSIKSIKTLQRMAQTLGD